MIEDFVNVADGTGYDTGICIIGAGAAGITLARSLLDSGLPLCLLESGGADFEAPTQNLAAGESIGQPYYPLEESRLRFFGGTTAIWGGRCAQLDAIDFRQRDWVTYSGWPFGKDVLTGYYRQAQGLLELPVIDNNMLPGFQSPLHTVCPAFWQFDERFDRFTLANCTDLVASAKVRILLHATATQIHTNADGSAIDSVTISNLHGGTGTVRARIFILATGGLEVPRLLLSSKSPTHPNGLGNHHDNVGRFFMEHPHARGALVHVSNPRQLFKLLPRFIRYQGRRFGMLFHPSDQLQETKGILNSGFTLAVRKHPGAKQVLYKQLYNSMRHEMSPTRFGRGLWKITRRVSARIQDRLGAYLTTRKLGREGYGLYAVIRAEQAPNPDSRIVLTDDRDALGMPRIALDWRLSAIDKDSIRILMKAFDEELRDHGLGSSEPADWLDESGPGWETDPLVSNHPIGGYHHMGTARMAANPRDGVVDANCRVHGVANLYIASSAVFPTAGWANPTLTILALSLRLADHLRREVK
jgi:choline dehydrogenase-like flavoprotein